SFMRIRSWSRVMPALFTRIVMTPNSFATSSISASTAPGSVTLSRRPTPPCTASAAPIASAPASDVAVPTTFAPSAARRFAIAAPMPRLAPVTSATSPLNVPVISFSRSGARLRQGRVQVRGRRRRAALELLVDTADEAGQHLARTALDEVGGVEALQFLY